jgi:hypothetical protein
LNAASLLQAAFKIQHHQKGRAREHITAIAISSGIVVIGVPAARVTFDNSRRTLSTAAAAAAVTITVKGVTAIATAVATAAAAAATVHAASTVGASAIAHRRCHQLHQFWWQLKPLIGHRHLLPACRDCCTTAAARNTQALQQQ